MAATAFYFTGFSYEGKSNKPHPITLKGFCANPDLVVNGDPIIPIDPPPDPWPLPPPGRGDITPPADGGWGYKDPANGGPGWYFVIVPGEGDATPKTPK